MNLEIKPFKGLDNIEFGATMPSILTLLGEPEEVEVLNEQLPEEAIAWHYHEKGFTLFFESGQLPRLANIEVFEEEATMFNQKVFNLDEKEILSLMKENGYSEYEAETHEWGERRITFEELNLDFYFEGEDLIAVNFGVFLDSNDTLGYAFN